MSATFAFGGLTLATSGGAVSGGGSFGFGGLSLTGTGGRPSIVLYDTDGTWLASLPKAAGIVYQQAMAPGTLACRLPLTNADGTTDTATALATAKRILKVFWRGGARQAARIDSSSVQWQDGRLWRVFNLIGAMSMAGDVAVYPEYGVDRTASGQRPFGYMSQRSPSWFKPADWGAPQGYGYTADTGYRAGKPPSLSFPNPSWIAKYGPYVTKPKGHTEYFRKEFTTYGSDIAYQLLFTADDFLTLWVDGEQIYTPDMSQRDQWRQLYQVTGTLQAGRHTLAAKVVNRRWAGPNNPVGFILTLQQLQKNGDVVPGRPIINTNLTWLVSDAAHVGFQRADILTRLFNEALARATAASQEFQAVNTLSLGFTHDRGSDGVAFTDDPGEHTLDHGSSYLDVITQMTEKALDVTVDAGTLQLRGYARLGSDKHTTVHLDNGAGRVGGNVQHTIDRVEAKGNTALMQLANGTWVEYQDSASVTAYGRIETGLSMGSTSDTGPASSVATGYFADNADTQLSFTVQLSDLAGPQVYRDFGLGDTVSVMDETGSYHAARVMTITVDASGTDERVKVTPELMWDRTI